VTSYSHLSRKIFLASALASAVVLSGCAVSSSAPVTSQIGAIQGRIHGGNQPVSGATLQLYKASTTGYSSTSTALIPTAVLSLPDGSFSITGKYPGYTCQTGDYLYIVATGGNPGVPGTNNNSKLALMTGLGPCANVTSSSFISINELTTVATAWALSPFMQRVTAVATSPTNIKGLDMAFAAINKLVNITTGTLEGPALPAGATIPVSELNTLADIIATCVNSVDTTSPAGPSAACQTLTTDETIPGTAVDTITAILDLAHAPYIATSLYTLATGTGAPFQPTLTGPPTAWTVAINYIGGGLNKPKGIALDTSGNVWIANSGANSVTKLDNTGAAQSPVAGYTAGAINAPTAIAIDLNGTPWVSNTGNSTVTHLSAGGLTGTAYGAGILSTPKGIAIDVDNDVWIANYGSSNVVELNSDGTPASLTPYTSGGINQPVAIAINPL
jgi:hypothetical protein